MVWLPRASLCHHVLWDRARRLLLPCKENIILAVKLFAIMLWTAVTVGLSRQTGRALTSTLKAKRLTTAIERWTRRDLRVLSLTLRVMARSVDNDVYDRLGGSW